MSLVIETTPFATVAVPALPASVAAERAETLVRLEERFGVPFALWNGDTGELVCAADNQPRGDTNYFGPLIQAASQRGVPQLLVDEPPVLLLAIPLAAAGAVPSPVATAAFVASNSRGGMSLSDAARLFDLPENHLADWIATHESWPVALLERLAHSVMGELAAEAKAARAEQEVEKISENLAGTYEEISLLYGLTQNLRLSGTDTQLGEITLEWLADCVEADGVAIQYLAVAKQGECTYQARTEPVLLTSGTVPLSAADFSELVAHLELVPNSGPYVANQGITGSAQWQWPEVRQLIVVPLAEGDNVFGWLAAFNHRENNEFGTVEASLLSSVSAILGIHCGNFDLYRRQAELLASMVRALTSAIDAKDQYTCGHSDRVARIAVRLAQELGCERDLLNTLYMAGLLHDIGKIGIDDQVLRKPGRLTEAEFKHIQEHPGLGYRILADIRELADVIPVVLHHHEQWNGKGYPHGLAGDEIPWLARIAAVADAFDAMTSDRPYRKGMPVEKVDEIFRKGAGQQWDATVIDAYFRCRSDILSICQHIRANLTLDVTQWS